VKKKCEKKWKKFGGVEPAIAVVLTWLLPAPSGLSRTLGEDSGDDWGDSSGFLSGHGPKKGLSPEMADSQYRGRLFRFFSTFSKAEKN